MNDPTPICAVDVTEDGKATIAPDLTPEPAPGALYRWLHFDLNDPNLAGWISATLAPIPGAALMQPETRPRCDLHDDGIILNLRGVNANPGQSADDMVSVRLWVTQTLIVSARVRKIFALDDIRANALEGDAPKSVGSFLARLADALTGRIERTTLALSETAETLEDLETDDPQHQAELRQSIIKFRRYIGPQRDALRLLTELETPILTKPIRHRLRESANRTMRSVEELDATRDRLTVVLDYWATKRETKRGDNAYILSVVAAIFLPLGFLTGLFGVNVAGMPGIDWPWAFAALTGGTVVAGVLVYLILRAMKWF